MPCDLQHLIRKLYFFGGCLREGLKWSSFFELHRFKGGAIQKKAGTESPTRSFYGGARPHELLRTDEVNFKCSKS
jgi:hypothetical protein